MDQIQDRFDGGGLAGAVSAGKSGDAARFQRKGDIA